MSPRRHFAAAVFTAAFVPSLAAYLATLAPTVPAGDSGELITAAATRGVAHPPGYPLYVATGWLWIHLLPFGEVAWRLNLLSAAAGAAAAGVLAAATTRLTGSFAAGLVAGFTFALAAPAWKYAVVAEVFTPNALLAALALLAFVAATAPPAVERRTARPAVRGSDSSAAGGAHPGRRGAGAVAKPNPNPNPNANAHASVAAWPFLVLALLATLLLSLHHTLVLLIAPLVAVLALRRFGPPAARRFLDGGAPHGLGPRARLGIALAALAGLLPLAIPPLAARSPGAQVWGDPTTLRGFLRLLLRADYGTFRLDPAAAGMTADRSHALLFLEALPGAVGPLALLLAALGLVVAWRRHRALALALAGFAAAQALFFARVGFPSTVPVLRGAVERFYILPIVALALLAGIGAAATVQALRRRWVGYVLAAIAFAWPLAAHRGLADQSRNHFTAHLGEAMLAALPPRAVLFVQGDLQHNALLYLTRVRGLRPDVTVVDQELLTYDWYARRVRRAHPDVLPPLGAAQRIRLRDGRAVEGMALARPDGRVDLLTEDGAGTVEATEVANVEPATDVAAMYPRTRAAFRNSWLVPPSDDRYSGLPGTRNLLWLEHLRGRRPVAFVGFKEDSWALRWEMIPVGLVTLAAPRGAAPSLGEQARQSLRSLAATTLDDYFGPYDPWSFEATERARLAAVVTHTALLLCQPDSVPAEGAGGDRSSARAGGAPDTAGLAPGRARLAAFARRFEPLDPTPDPACLRALGMLHVYAAEFRDLPLARRLLERSLASGVSGSEADEARRVLAGLAGVR